MSNLKCDHKKTKMKMVSWATDDRYGHEQGFTMKNCCVRCGAVVLFDPPKKKLTDKEFYKKVMDGGFNETKESSG